ncbi:hypothetical protein GCM10010837_10960 [Aminobacter niigataensis]
MPFRFHREHLCRWRQVVEGERDSANESTAADRAEHDVGRNTFRRQLVERFEPGTGLAGDDFGVVEGMEQGEALGVRDFARLGGGDFFAGAVAMVGQHHAGAVTLGRLALGCRHIDRHDDGDGNAERLAGGGKALGEVAGRIGNHAAPRLVSCELLEPPVGAARLERACPLQRLRLDEDARRAGLAGQRSGFEQGRQLRRTRCFGIGLAEPVQGGNCCRHHSPLGKRLLSSSTFRSMWLRM